MLRTLTSSVFRGKRALVRVDFNVPIVRGRAADDFRIRAAIPTIRYLIARRNTVILLSHHSDNRQSLLPAAKRLAVLLGRPVRFVRDPSSRNFIKTLARSDGRVFLLENLRFWEGEESCDPAFARSLARIGDVYVNDAFGVLHRRAASLTVLPRLLPSFLGFRAARELAMLDRVLQRPARPLVAIFGGAKIDTKLAALRRFSSLADKLLLGGGIANTLLLARGVAVGRSLATAPTPAIRRYARSPRLILPIDAVVAHTPPGGVQARVVAIGRVRATERICDIGPQTAALFRRSLRPARTVVWNGPLGLVEDKRFRAGTVALARALAAGGKQVVIGGGDTVAFLRQAGLVRRSMYISTGGGAMLAYLAREKLPGLEALKQSASR